MYSKEERIQIDASPEEVYRYVSDFKRHPEWASNPMEMTVDGEVAPGTSFSTTVKAFGSETAKGRVLEVQPPSLLKYETDTSTSGRYIWTMTLTPSGTGTELAHRFERVEAPGWFKVAQALTFPFVGRKMMVTGLRNIKARVETDASKGHR